MENFKIWCWRKVEKIRWINRLRNEEVSMYREERKRGEEYRTNSKTKEGYMDRSHTA